MGYQNIIARETTTDRDRERGRLNQHSDVVNRECWLRPTGARRPIALADRLAVIGEDLDLVDVVEGDLADVLGIGQVLVGRPIVDRGEHRSVLTNTLG